MKYTLKELNEKNLLPVTVYEFNRDLSVSEPEYSFIIFGQQYIIKSAILNEFQIINLN